MIKNPPAMWETWVQSLGQKDPLEEGMATHSSILAWEIPWIAKTGRGCKALDTTERLTLFKVLTSVLILQTSLDHG